MTVPKFKKELENRCLVFMSSRKSEIGRRGRARTLQKCIEKREARAKLLFCESKPIDLLPFSDIIIVG